MKQKFDFARLLKRAKSNFVQPSKIDFARLEASKIHSCSLTAKRAKKILLAGCGRDEFNGGAMGVGAQKLFKFSGLRPNIGISI